MARRTAQTPETPQAIESLGVLVPDPENARRHNPRNIGMIEQAIAEVGAARSIVIDEHNRVLAGNGTVEGAAQAGIESVMIVDAPGDVLVAVRRTGLTPEQKRKLALFDNRTAELADWDPNALLALAEEVNLAELFYDGELADLVKQAERERRRPHEVFARPSDDDDSDDSGGDGARHDGAPHPAASPAPQRQQRGYPLAIVVDRATYARWEAYKGLQRLRDDTTAFVRLLRSVAPDGGPDEEA